MRRVASRQPDLHEKASGHLDNEGQPAHGDRNVKYHGDVSDRQIDAAGAGLAHSADYFHIELALESLEAHLRAGIAAVAVHDGGGDRHRIEISPSAEAHIKV